MTPTSYTTVSNGCRTSSPRNKLHIKFVCCMIALLSLSGCVHGCELCRSYQPAVSFQSQLASAYCPNQKDVCMSHIDCVRKSGSPQSVCSQGTCCRLPSIRSETPRRQSTSTSRSSDQQSTFFERCSATDLCMAHIDCMRENGLPQALCAYGSQVGSCCKLPENKPGIGLFSQEDGGVPKSEFGGWPTPAMFFKDGVNQDEAIRQYSRAREAAFAKRELARQAKAMEHSKKLLEEKRKQDQQLESWNDNIFN